MNFEEWWAYKEFGFGTKWLEPIAKPIAEEVWNAAKEDSAKEFYDLMMDKGMKALERSIKTRQELMK